MVCYTYLWIHNYMKLATRIVKHINCLDKFQKQLNETIKGHWSELK